MNNKTKTYIVNDVEMKFNLIIFEILFNQERKKRGLRTGESEEALAEALGVSSDAVHSWRFGMNAPATIRLLKKVSDYFGLKSFLLLLVESEEELNQIISGRQMDSLKKVYDAVIDFLCGDEVSHDDVIHTFRREYILLHKLDIYSQLAEFVHGDLVEIDRLAALSKINSLLDPYMN